MKVLVYHGPRILKLEEQEIPRPGPGEVLLRVGAVGICGSEIEGYLGMNSLRVPPLIMGHEFSGEVVALGDGEQHDVQVGQRVVVNPLVGCGDCAFCHAGLSYLCPKRWLIGAHRPGAFADYVIVPLSSIIPLAANTDFTVAALAEPFAVALHGVSLARISPEDAVVVWGAGSIGLLTICAARLAGPARIIAVDTNAVRLDAAQAMGATTVFDARDPQVVATIREHLDTFSRVVALDAVGRAETRNAAVAAAGPGGTAVMLGLHDKETTFDVSAIIRSEVAIQGSYAYTDSDVRRAVALLEAGEVKLGSWFDIRPLTSGADSFAELVDRPGVATKIMLVP